MRFLKTLFLIALLPGVAQAQSRFDRATSIGTADSIRSATLDEVRPFLVYTPPSYADSAAPNRYPVVYLLDGDAHFHSVSGLLQILGTGVNGTYVVPEMIVVAIPNTNRTRDLTPTRTEIGFDGRPQPAFEASGGGTAFLRFVRDELIPHIEAQYRTLPYRVFVGHSFGGITALHALYTMPETFNAYVAIDPSLWWDGQTLLRQARVFFESASLEGRALYVAQANTINAADTTRNLHFESITRFDAIMRAYDRSGLRYGFRYYDADDHGSVPLIAEYDALRFIFDGYRVPLLRVVDEPRLLNEHFRDVSARLGATFRPSASMLMQLGQFALTRDTASAIEFGEMHVAQYPEDARAYEFLGDVRAARGEVERARRYYEQALARNGDRSRVREKVGKLGRGGR
jgi:uncharacterized protein